MAILDAAAPPAPEPNDIHVTLPAGARTIDNEPETAPPPTDDNAPAPTTSSNGNGHRPKTAPAKTAVFYDLDAEYHLLAELTYQQHAIPDALTVITPADLTDTGAAILHTIVDLAATGERFDSANVAQRLGKPELVATFNTHSTGAWKPHARHLADLARRRRTWHAATELAKAATEGADERADYWTERLNDTAAATIDSTWQRIDLGPVIDGEQLTHPPSILHRDDGQALIYPGKVHAFNAESESGKSWLALWACIEELRHGNTVAYLDFEDGAAGVTERLLNLGADRQQLTDQFWYIRPDDPISPAALTAITAATPTLVVIDGITEVMAQNGWSIKENDDAAQLLARLARPLTFTGAAVILIDHVVKNRQERGKDAIGGQHKRAGIDGASYMLDIIRPFGRGMAGAARITITKDRPGHIRPNCAAGHIVGELRLTSTGNQATLIVAAPTAITDPDQATRRTFLMEAVSKEIESINATGEHPTTNQLCKTVKAKRREYILGALDTLIAERYVTVEPGPRNSKLHLSERPYRQADDPRSDRYTSADTTPPDDDPYEDF